MTTIHELAAEGTSIHAIATMLGLSRDTERKYQRWAVDAHSDDTTVEGY